jgi:hypothetical protein
MYLLYADESGSVGDSKQQFFVLAGFCVFERQGYWFAQELDKIAARFNPADPVSLELHGNPMHSGKGIFGDLQSPTALWRLKMLLAFSQSRIRAIGFLHVP